MLESFFYLQVYNLELVKKTQDIKKLDVLVSSKKKLKTGYGKNKI